MIFRKFIDRLLKREMTVAEKVIKNLIDDTKSGLVWKYRTELDMPVFETTYARMRIVMKRFGVGSRSHSLSIDDTVCVISYLNNPDPAEERAHELLYRLWLQVYRIHSAQQQIEENQVKEVKRNKALKAMQNMLDIQENSEADEKE